MTARTKPESPWSSESSSRSDSSASPDSPSNADLPASPGAALSAPGDGERASEASLSLVLHDEQATGRLAASIAPCVGPGFRLYLSGDLGAGKTAFTRALLRALGHRGRVRSPTFTLAEPYQLSSFELYHFDFYRFSSSDEWREAGFAEYLDGPGAAVVEWPERAGDRLAPADLHLHLGIAQEDVGEQRVLRLVAASARGRECLRLLARRLDEAGIDGVGWLAPHSAPS